MVVMYEDALAKHHKCPGIKSIQYLCSNELVHLMYIFILKAFVRTWPSIFLIAIMIT